MHSIDFRTYDITSLCIRTKKNIFQIKKLQIRMGNKFRIENNFNYNIKFIYQQQN